MSIEDEAQDEAHKTTTASTTFEWDTISILQSIAIFILTGFAEIIGGWLVWVAIKGIRVEESGMDSNNVSDSGENDEESISSPSQYIIVKKPWYYALLGSLTLVAYGFIPLLQPSAASDGFARIYAAYGGFFIVLSFLVGWALEGPSAKPDIGDLVGGGIALVGAGVIMFWPRD